GLQVQIWSGNSNVASKTWDTWAVMNTPNEAVTWTQYLDIRNGPMTFGISAASSQTWNDFSGQQIGVPTNVQSLDNYTVDYSVANPGNAFGANRVTYLAITAVRIYYQDGSVQEDLTERIVYPAADNSPWPEPSAVDSPSPSKSLGFQNFPSGCTN